MGVSNRNSITRRKSIDKPDSDGAAGFGEPAASSSDSFNGSPVRRRQSAAAASAELNNRFQKKNTVRELVADGAVAAREWLMPFANMETPRYTMRDAIVFGLFVDWAIALNLPVGSDFHRYIIRSGGMEQLRFLLVVAQFDIDANGKIDDMEFELYEKHADESINEAVTFSSNLAVVGALMLGLTHYITLGRPSPYVLSPASKDLFGEAGQVRGLFYLMCLNHHAQLPHKRAAVAREQDLAAASDEHAWGTISWNALDAVVRLARLASQMFCCLASLGKRDRDGVNKNMLWPACAIMSCSRRARLSDAYSALFCRAFVLSTVAGTLVHSPSFGALGFIFWMIVCGLTTRLVAPIRYIAAVLLHEEIKRVLQPQKVGRNWRQSQFAFVSQRGGDPISPRFMPRPRSDERINTAGVVLESTPSSPAAVQRTQTDSAPIARAAPQLGALAEEEVEAAPSASQRLCSA
eukprot:2323793-Pleurochrysis_carterae.AAC.3